MCLSSADIIDGLVAIMHGDTANKNGRYVSDIYTTPEQRQTALIDTYSYMVRWNTSQTSFEQHVQWLRDRGLLGVDAIREIAKKHGDKYNVWTDETRAIFAEYEPKPVEAAPVASTEASAPTPTAEGSPMERAVLMVAQSRAIHAQSEALLKKAYDNLDNILDETTQRAAAERGFTMPEPATDPFEALANAIQQRAAQSTKTGGDDENNGDDEIPF